jgi:hypothetical protein
MNTSRFLAGLCSAFLLCIASHAVAGESCPRTIGANKAFVESWPQSNTWFGSEALAVLLPEDGIWPTTKEGHSIAVKLFWYSAGFKPGMERDFVGRIDRLDDGPNDAEISRPTNAGLGNDVWTILTGIDFKSVGCWRITGEYQGQTLQFVVETLRSHDYRNRKRSN